MIDDGYPQRELITLLFFACHHREHNETVLSANQRRFFHGLKLQP